MPRPSLKFIDRFTDHNGHERHYCRRADAEVPT